jgi:hypothetical protein
MGGLTCPVCGGTAFADRQILWAELSLNGSSRHMSVPMWIGSKVLLLHYLWSDPALDRPRLCNSRCGRHHLDLAGVCQDLTGRSSGRAGDQ